MPRRRYSFSIRPTDTRPGWKLGRDRVAPRGFTIGVRQYFRYSQDFSKQLDLSDAETDALLDPASTTSEDWEMIGSRKWLELEVVSSPTKPPRCVVLRAPGGISTPEQRFPLAGIVAQATATIASKDGTFVDYPREIEYEDMLAYASAGARTRKRPPRSAVTRERLEEVARVVAENPMRPNPAVRRLGYSRGYAWKLIKMAEREGL